MGESNRNIKAKIKELDATQPSPDERAKVVFHLLKTHFPELTEWDLLCFSAEFLGYMSQRYLWMQAEAKKMCSLVYNAHYVLNEQHDTETGLKSTDGNSPQDTNSGTEQRTEQPPYSFGFTIKGGGYG